jgi:very-short-patch-repair endonuclease
MYRTAERKSRIQLPYLSSIYFRCETQLCSNKYAKFWNNELNKNNTPRNVFKNSAKEIYFNCNNCHHIFKVKLALVNLKNQWCNYCSNSILCNNNECSICFNKSFASSDKSKYWCYDLNKITPRQIFLNKPEKFWFECSLCKHKFENSPHKITQQNSWCPYCTNRKLCNDKECIICFDKSFASCKNSILWHKTLNKDILPLNVFKGSIKKFWFTCNICNHDFYSVLQGVARGSSCPLCKYKTEKKLLQFLKKKYHNVKYQFKVEWCKNKTYLPYDFSLIDYKIIIELDGKQHFKQVANWKNPDEMFINDKFKEKCALSNDFKIIRILQDDVLNDKFNWKEELICSIEKLYKDNYNKCIYICKNNEYVNYIE